MGADEDKNAKPDAGAVAHPSSGERARGDGGGESPPVDSSEYRDYVVKGVEGQGGLGRVLRAHDRRLDRVVALKEMLHSDGDGTDGSSRFLREARLTARLQHPSIVPVYEIGFRADGAPFYAMKLIAGERFDKVIARCRSLTERLALLPNVIAVTEAVAYAHDHRIIHRDLKPSNVIVGAFGETVVIDWGVAKDLAVSAGSMPPPHAAVAHAPRARSSALEDTLLDLGGDSAARTVAGRMLGTLGYMPPEQYQGEEVDERADVFALGAFLYQTVTGAGPYEGDSELAMLSRIEKGMPRPVESREPALPLDLGAIVRKAMAPRREERYASAKELAADLKRFQTGQLVAAHDYSPGLLVARWVGRHTRAVVTVAVFAAVLAVLGVVSVRRIVRERDRAESERARAQMEQERAEARTQEVTLVQARTSLDRDPTASLSWLKTARFDDASHDEMASIAADARARGVARVILHAKGIGEVTTPAMSLDGRRVFVSPEGSGVVEWDLGDGNRVHMHGDPVTLDEVERPTADGTRVYSGSREGGILEIDLTTGATRVLEGHRGLSITANAPTGHAFASCAEDGSVRVWDDGGSRVLGQLDGACHSVSYSPDGASLVAAGDGALRFFTIATGASRALRASGVHEAAWAPDGKTILTGSDDGIGTLDLASGAMRALPTSAGALTFRFIPNANAIAFGGIDASLHVVDLDRLTDRLLHGHTAAIQHLDVSRDGRRMLSCADDDTSRLWDLATGASRALLGHAAVHNCRFSIDERQVMTSGNDGKVRLWDLPQHETRVLPGHEHDVYGLAFSPDGALVASASYDTTVRVWNVATGKQTILRGHTGPARNVLFLDRSHVASASSDGTVRVWNLDDQRSVVLPHGMHVRRMVATKDGKTLVTDCQDGIARVWDVVRGVALPLVGHKGPVIGVALSPDETRIATSSDDHTVRVWDRATGVSQLVLEPPPGGRVTGVAFAKGGALVAASSADGAARLWDAGTGALVRVLTGHGDRIEGLSVSPDGETVATASDDRTVRLWNVETGASKVLVGHTSAVVATVFSPDGRWIASTSYDATTRLWDARTGKLLTLGRSDAPVQCAAFAPDGSWLAAAGFDRAVRLMPIDEAQFVPADAGAFRAWVGEMTTAVVMGANEIGSEVVEEGK